MASPAAPAGARGLGAAPAAPIEGPACILGAPALDIAGAARTARRDIASLRSMLKERARTDSYLR
eukprot:6186410-Pleurochrysis_carterae.AAC.3